MKIPIPYTTPLATIKLKKSVGEKEARRLIQTGELLDVYGDNGNLIGVLADATITNTEILR